MENLSKRIIKKTEREKAQAMVVAFIYVSVVALIAVYMMTYAHNLHNVVVREVKHSMSFYTGESALIQAEAALTAGGACPATIADVPPQMTVAISSAAAGGGTTRITARVDWNSL